MSNKMSEGREGIEEIFQEYEWLSKEGNPIMHIGGERLRNLKNDIEALVHQEHQKVREEERERVLAKWNELYRNKAYSPGMITLEFSRFVKDITSNKTKIINNIMSQLKSNEEIVEHYAELFGYKYKGDFALHCNHLREILAEKDAELQKAREEERERIEAIFKEHVPPHAMDLEDSVWLKRLLNKAFGHENIY